MSKVSQFTEIPLNLAKRLAIHKFTWHYYVKTLWRRSREIEVF